MAITIQSEPQDFNPVNNPCEFTFSSTQTGEDNFSFLVRLDINGSTHSFHQVFPESSNYGYFDASEILRSYVESKLITDGVIEVPTSTYTVSYDIAVKERFGTPPADDPDGDGWVDSNTLTGINGALRKVEWTNYDHTDYVINTSNLLTNGQILSNFPTDRTRFCGLQESQFLACICEDTSAEIDVTLRDVSGSTVANVTQAITLPSNDFVIVDVSPQTLISDTSLTSANFDNSYDYVVDIVATGAGGNASSTRNTTIIIDRECSLYDGKRLHWLNKFGAWDSFSFRLYHEDNTNVTTKEYQQSFGEWNSSNERVFNRYEGEQTAIMKRSTDTLTLNSDWIHEDEQQWLSRSLYESPRVYLEVSQGVFEPVIVQKSKYKQKQRVREGLIQENVTVKKTYEYLSQIN